MKPVLSRHHLPATPPWLLTLIAVYICYDQWPSTHVLYWTGGALIGLWIQYYHQRKQQQQVNLFDDKTKNEHVP